MMPETEKKYRLAAVLAAAGTAIVNLLSWFFLPAELRTFPGLASPGKTVFLIAFFLLVAMSAAMTAFGPSKKRWAVTGAILIALDLTVIAVNLIR